MAARKAQAEQAPDPARKEAEDLHRLLVGVREQMEYMLRERFAAIEAAVENRMRERDSRNAAAEALIARLQQENAERETAQGKRLAAAEALLEKLQREAAASKAEAEKHAEKVARLRQLAMETA